MQTFKEVSYLEGYRERFVFKYQQKPNLTWEQYSTIFMGNYLDYMFDRDKCKPPEELSFTAIQAQPYVFVNQRDDSFDIYGPLFSVFAEIAKRLNFRSVMIRNI